MGGVVLQLTHHLDRGRHQLEYRRERDYSVPLHHPRCDEGQCLPAAPKSRPTNPITTRRITACLLAPVLVRTRTNAKSVERTYNVDEMHFRVEPGGFAEFSLRARATRGHATAWTHSNNKSRTTSPISRFGCRGQTNIPLKAPGRRTPNNHAP
jgi:hypothetical protein